MTSPIVDTTLSELRKVKRLADKAIAQLDDRQLWVRIDPEANSVGVLMRHMAGNMRSRWTEFLTSDGEKPDRNRDSEFVSPPGTREDLLNLWEKGWACVFRALEPLNDGDMTRTVTIRGEEMSVMQAINRQMTHYAYHVGQIVCLARHYARDAWQPLTIPKKRAELLTEPKGGA